MKKIILSLFLFLGFTYAESPIKRDSEVGEWRSFVGVEGGVGVFGVFPAIFLSLNPSFHPKGNPFGLGYSIGFSGGWQKYTFEKVGLRNTLGFLFSYVPDLASIQRGSGDNCMFCKSDKPTDFKGISGQGYNFYYALDGLFDFVKNGETRFGMSLGFRIAVTGTSGQNGLYGFLATYGARTGLYAKFNDSLLDLTFSISITGAGIGDIIYDAPFMLGYKHLF